MTYTTIDYFLLIFFDLVLFLTGDVFLDFSLSTLGLLKSLIIFSASFILISLEVRIYF